jgi:hypothetical protein
MRRPAAVRTFEAMKKLLIPAIALVGLVVMATAFTSPGSGPGAAHVHPPTSRTATPQGIAPLLANARLATARYATNLRRAKRDGYTTVVTQHMPDMGWHFMNPKLTDFDVTKPAILVYVKRGGRWQLVAFEWVFPKRPAKDPLPGAQYGSFAAACHYVDGTFTPAAAEDDCAGRSPQSGAKFGFWHPDLVTLHLWAWYPNPDGIYNGTNPLIRPFN